MRSRFKIVWVPARSTSVDEDEEANTTDGMSDTPPSVTLQQRQGSYGSRSPATPDVRLYHRAVVVAQESTGKRFI